MRIHHMKMRSMIWCDFVWVKLTFGYENMHKIVKDYLWLIQFPVVIFEIIASKVCLLTTSLYYSNKKDKFSFNFHHESMVIF